MSYQHLSATDRGQIQALLEEGRSQAYIADKLGRHRSTISRECRRNRRPSGYEGQHAHAQRNERRAACRPTPKLAYPPLRKYLFDKIPEGWSPEQIAGRLPLDYPDDPRMRISHEAIYQSLYTDSRLRCLIRYLPQARPKRRKRGQGKSRRGPAIPNRVGIEQRPPEVDTRERYGDWEGDTMVGANQQAFVATLAERKSLLVSLRKTESKNADEVAAAIHDALLDWPASWLKTLTLDNGTEFAHHERIRENLPITIYFAAPYAAYQRGTNENTNGLIRRFLPKGTDFRTVTQTQLDHIAHLLNNRPRKKLAYRTPYEVFQQQRLASCVALRV